MKKIIIASLLMTSAVAFAKTESPNKIEEPKNTTETVLVAKKTIENTNQLQKPIALSTTAKERELTNEEKCIIELALGPIFVGPAVHCFQLESEGVS
ncbi:MULTISPECIES: hypothetical protein [unclassified Chryseobacterium]|uniref:hypothetical protein n=1 Tax=unclassified Chryseobacterium TaxID=2593645 RepID=UPI001AE3617D|nr:MULTISPECIES: hypothetical protein [unclassified Chryseobacterium]MBP1166581.1 beta-lactam-binding protein with PASTA domain [Chryseobacterium sp. PvR013]MDR4891774.1 hypothetical protein [Chryseobacterium sp. CFS7]